MSEGKKRKKSYYQGKHGGKRSRHGSELAPKMKGFLVTTSGKEKSATQEAYRLLNEYADKKYGPEDVLKGDESDSGDGDEDIEAALKKQVTGIKETNKKGADRRFQSVQNKARNVIFIKTNIADPTELVTDIFLDLKSSGVQKTQHCQRMIPVIDTCYAKIDHILTAAKPLVKTNFHEAEKPFSFSLKWKARCNGSLKRDEVYSALVKMIWEVEKGHRTDYDNPELVFNVDIVGNVCCFGFLRNYNNFAKYNVDMVCKKETEKINDEAIKQENNSSEVDVSADISAETTLESDNKEMQDEEEDKMTNTDVAPDNSVQNVAPEQETN